jgi:DNA-binding response OmpR family regulator
MVIVELARYGRGPFNGYIYRSVTLSYVTAAIVVVRAPSWAYSDGLGDRSDSCGESRIISGLLEQERTIPVARQKILIVDDDENICDLVRLQLEMAGFEPICANDGREALTAARDQKPALIVLDLILPEMDGLEVLREVRRFANIPVVMLTGRSDEFDRVLGLEMGADDYVTKPFSPRELIARIRAVLRRSNLNQTSDEHQELNLHGFYLNMMSREVRINERRIELTPKEFDLLWQLASNRDRVFTRSQLLKKVWDYEDFFGDERTVDQHVKRLRRKIEDERAPCRITTIWGVGYKFELTTG